MILNSQLQPEGSFERKIVEGSKKSLTDLTAFVNTITQQLWTDLERDENKFEIMTFSLTQDTVPVRQQSLV